MPDILVINPNISESVTCLIEQEARKAAHADTRISMATAAFGVEYIETRSEAAIGAHAVLDIVANAGDAFDAIVIAEVDTRTHSRSSVNPPDETKAAAAEASTLRFASAPQALEADTQRPSMFHIGSMSSVDDIFGAGVFELAVGPHMVQS